MSSDNKSDQNRLFTVSQNLRNIVSVTESATVDAYKINTYRQLVANKLTIIVARTTLDGCRQLTDKGGNISRTSGGSPWSTPNTEFFFNRTIPLNHLQSQLSPLAPG